MSSERHLRSVPDRADSISWIVIVVQSLWFYIVTRTICRLGHRPSLFVGSKTDGSVIAEMSCKRCQLVLDLKTVKPHKCGGAA